MTNRLWIALIAAGAIGLLGMTTSVRGDDPNDKGRDERNDRSGPDRGGRDSHGGGERRPGIDRGDPLGARPGDARPSDPRGPQDRGPSDRGGPPVSRTSSARPSDPRNPQDRGSSDRGRDDRGRNDRGPGDRGREATQPGDRRSTAPASPNADLVRLLAQVRELSAKIDQLTRQLADRGRQSGSGRPDWHDGPSHPQPSFGRPHGFDDRGRSSGHHDYHSGRDSRDHRDYLGGFSSRHGPSHHENDRMHHSSSGWSHGHGNDRGPSHGSHGHGPSGHDNHMRHDRR